MLPTISQQNGIVTLTTSVAIPENFFMLLHDSVSAVVTYSNTLYDNMNVPTPGEIAVNGAFRCMRFNTSEVGAVVTGKPTIIVNS